jgi:hypothetical protein
MVDQITPHTDWRRQPCPSTTTTTTPETETTMTTQLPLPTTPLPETMTGRVFAWLDRLDAIAPEGYTYECDTPGQKFVRIVMLINGKRNSVHAFYDMRTGDVYKAASFKAPAKHVRFNLMDDASFARMIEVATWSGGYLYINR